MSQTIEHYGHHVLWCTDREDRLHDDRAPYCNYQVGGVEGVTEPDWKRTQLWVAPIHAFLHGTYTREESQTEERNRTGVQLSYLVHNGDEWVEANINLRSGDARSLAALLVAAADISDGINRAVRS